MSKTVDAIVRGPRPYFGKDGKLYAPGQIAPDVPAEDVGKDGETHEKTAMVKLDKPTVIDGKVVSEAPQTVDVPYKFRPLGSGAIAAQPTDTAEVATGQPDRLNVTDFLKQGNDEIVAAIVTGSVDDHLGVIEQAELARKGPARKAVKDAISARLAAMSR